MSDWIASGLFVAGGVFCLIAGIGLLRMRDVYCRMHAATKAGTLGLALVCLGAIVVAASWQQVLELAFVFFFMIGTAPVGAHLIGRAAFRTGVPTAPTTQSDPACEAFRRPRPG